MPQWATKTATLMVRLSPEDKARVQELAERLGVSLSAAAVIMIRAYPPEKPEAPPVEGTHA